MHRANGLRTYVDTAPPSVPAAKRPALQKLLADVAAGRAETVVCTTLGRLATDRATREEIGAQIAAHGVRLVTTEQEIASAGSAVSTGVAGSARRRQQ